MKRQMVGVVVVGGAAESVILGSPADGDNILPLEMPVGVLKGMMPDVEEAEGDPDDVSEDKMFPGIAAREQVAESLARTA